MLLEQLRQPVFLFTVGFALLILLFSLFDPFFGHVLEYDQNKIKQGELWRLVTGNFVHFGLYHTVMNLCSIIMISTFLFGTYPAWVWVGLFFLIPLIDGCGLYWFSHDIDIYRGYSGAVYGLAFVGLVLNWRVNPWVASVVMLGLAGKLFYERLPSYDVNFLVDKIGVPVAVDAHLWGGLAGVILSIPLWWILQKSIPKNLRDN